MSILKTIKEYTFDLTKCISILKINNYIEKYISFIFPDKTQLLFFPEYLVREDIIIMATNISYGLNFKVWNVDAVNDISVRIEDRDMFVCEKCDGTGLVSWTDVPRLGRRGVPSIDMKNIIRRAPIDPAYYEIMIIQTKVDKGFELCPYCLGSGIEPEIYDNKEINHVMILLKNES